MEAARNIYRSFKRTRCSQESNGSETPPINLDVLTVSETHLTNDIHNEDVNIDGYQVLRRDRTHKGGGLRTFNQISSR